MGVAATSENLWVIMYIHFKFQRSKGVLEAQEKLYSCVYPITGTHGHMKCVFDGQLKSQDTILMNLYKRVFPKWTYDPCLVTATPRVANDVEME